MRDGQDNETLLVFPCDFTIKVIGKNSEEFEAAVLMIVHQQMPGFADRMIESRDSGNSKYRALSLTVHVTSKDQLDDLYYALSANPLVIMAL